MPLVVRLGDTSNHGGAVATSASRWLCEGKPIARKGDLFDCPVHGRVRIATGSAKWKCEGLPIARTGDITDCGASLISGASFWSAD